MVALSIEALELPVEVSEWDFIASHELEDADRNQVHAFREALSVCMNNGIKTIDIEKRQHLITDDSKSLDTQLQRGITERNMERLCLSPNYEWLAGAGLNKFHILRSARAETSAHHVFFGVIHGDDVREGGIEVAIKPCVEKPEKATHDWLNNHLAKRADEQTFEPIGFMLHNGVGYSLTKLERGVETLDTSDWTQVLPDVGNEAYDGQRETLKQLAQGLAQLHQKGIYHGDPQFKNIAQDITGNLYFIDWESATFFDEPPENSIAQSKMLHDLKVLFGSMAMSPDSNGTGLLSNFHYPVQWDFFKQYAFDPYLERYFSGHQNEEAALEQQANIEERMKQYVLNGEIYQSFSRTRTHHQ